MKKLFKNKKGFTLIELLAVIVILGILMIVAIPMVTRYIESARKDTYIDTAKAYINSARYTYLAGDYTCTSALDGYTAGSAYVRLTDVDIDNSGGKSSFGGSYVLNESYVLIESDGNGKFTYSIAIRDDKKYGIKSAVAESALAKSDVKSGVASLTAAPTSNVCTKSS